MKSAELVGQIPEQNEKQSNHYEEGQRASSDSPIRLLGHLDGGRESPPWDL